MLITELRNAIAPNVQTGHFTGRSLPVSSLRILTKPPQAKIFVDNVSVGQSRDDGWLMLDGIQSGNHHLRVSHDGFDDWLGDVVCDGKPQQVVAELKTGLKGAIPNPFSGEKTEVLLPQDPYATRIERTGTDINANTSNVTPIRDNSGTAYDFGSKAANVPSQDFGRTDINPNVTGSEFNRTGVDPNATGRVGGASSPDMLKTAASRPVPIQ